MHNERLFVDHVFMLIEKRELEAVTGALSSQGLTESSRRSHPGLGTANLFFCFDNLFLEILWIEDRQQARQTRLSRQLLERLDGRERGAMPFGIGLRTPEPSDDFPLLTRGFQPPAALRGFKQIPVACSSDDVCQPLLFRAKRNSRPDAWTDGDAGDRQQPAGIAEVSHLRLSLAPGFAASDDLVKLEKLGLIDMENAANGPFFILTLSDATGLKRGELTLTSPLRTEEQP